MFACPECITETLYGIFSAHIAERSKLTIQLTKSDYIIGLIMLSTTKDYFVRIILG